MPSRPRTNAAAILAVVLGTALAGCSDIYYDRRESIAAHAGDSVMTNQVTHMVDPWSRASANRNLAFNGERMQGARQPQGNGIARGADIAGPGQDPLAHLGMAVESSCHGAAEPCGKGRAEAVAGSCLHEKRILYGFVMHAVSPLRQFQASSGLSSGLNWLMVVQRAVSAGFFSFSMSTVTS